MMKSSWEITSQIEDAVKAVEEADQRAVADIVEQQMGRPPLEGISPQKARAVVEKLQDEHTTLQRAREHLATQRHAVERVLEMAQSSVREGIRNASQADPNINALCA
jgi:hypothetical protein